MTAVLRAEASRLVEQKRLDLLKDAKERNKWGQFATPPALSLDIARYVWNTVRRRKGGFRFLDPALGTGSFFSAFLQTFPKDRIEAATGIELDEPFAEAAMALWRSQGLRVITGDFARQKPESTYNVILTNPPYVRHHHLTVDDKQRLGNLAEQATGIRLNGLAGLYCYFLLIAHAWLAENGLSVWLVPSEFMEVNYGEGVKRYLTERVSLRHIHRFCPSDVQFDDALVSSVVVVFEKSEPKANHEVVFSFGGTLTKPASSESFALDDVRTMKKWTSFTGGHGRGPGGLRKSVAHTVTLGDLFAIKRGLATGNNDFFIVPRGKVEEFGIPGEYVRPILPSPRFLQQEIIEAEADGWPAIDRQLALIDCALSEEEISRKWPRFAQYLRAGKEQGVHRGYLASRRFPWYSQEKREPSPFVCTYMGRSLERPFRFMLNRSKATAANVYHLLYPKRHVVHAVTERMEEVFDALRTIQPEDFFSQGRVYGGGLYKMEPAEMMRLPADNLIEVLGTKLERQMSLL